MKLLLIFGLLVLGLMFFRSKNKQVQQETSRETVTQSQIDSVVQATDAKVLLYFWKPNCPGCETMGPIVDKVAKEYPHIPVIKINTREEKNRPVHDAYTIRATPSFVLIQKGKVVGRYERPFAGKTEYLSFLRPSKVY